MKKKTKKLLPLLMLIVLIATLVITFRTVFPARASSQINTVFVIVMENQDWSHVKNSSSAPYINSLLPKAAHAEQYYSPPGISPSLPNYLWLEAGTNFGIQQDIDPSSYSWSTSNHLVSLLDKASISWKAYEEGITGTTCPVQSNGLYAPKHDPFVYFNDVTNNPDPNYCTKHIVPYTQLSNDLTSNNVGRYNFITPNLCDDMHNACQGNKIAQGDTWLSQNVPAILNSSAYKNNGALFITWDEPESSNSPIGMIALSLLAKVGYQNSIHYTHGSTLRTLEEIFGVTPLLGDAAQETDLSGLFMPSAFSTTGTTTPTNPNCVTPYSTPTSATPSPSPISTSTPSPIASPSATSAHTPTQTSSPCCPSSTPPVNQGHLHLTLPQ